jgi:hypothetical protein
VFPYPINTLEAISRASSVRDGAGLVAGRAQLSVDYVKRVSQLIENERFIASSPLGDEVTQDV